MQLATRIGLVGVATLGTGLVMGSIGRKDEREGIELQGTVKAAFIVGGVGGALMTGASLLGRRPSATTGLPIELVAGPLLVGFSGGYFGGKAIA